MSHFSLDEARRSRFVTVCQHFLALAVILALLTPAARTVTMDVRPVPAGDPGRASAADGAGVALRAARTNAVVPTSTVDPEVEEYPLTAPAGARLAPGAMKAQARTVAGGGERIVTDALPVDGYGTVGVTWAAGTDVEDDAISVRARTRTGDTWSTWTEVEYHDEHGPDPDSAEGQHARPGTDALLIGTVDDVQVRVDSDVAAPSDMKLAVIDPGTTSMARQAAAIDTAELDGPAGGETREASYRVEVDGEPETLSLAAGDPTPKPKIFSRQQWGADERLRDRSSLRYYEVHAGFVHHTVNANDYTRAQVPGIIRGIYAYHTRSRGWSDIGYNFLVDKFGRVWEGRYGGVDRPVVGAHTLGYNDDAFAMSAIGNFETARPSSAMVQAYGRLFAWKLSLHGVSAGSSRQGVAGRTFAAINGHRDAGSTACPGRYLYAKIGRIRAIAAETQTGWESRDLDSDLVRGPAPDLILRRKSDGKAFTMTVQRTKSGTVRLSRARPAAIDLTGAVKAFTAGDWDRDGVGDIVVRKRADMQRLYLYRGLGRGKYAAPTVLTQGFAGMRMVSIAGDVTGDGYPDVLAQPNGGDMMIYPGRGTAGLGRGFVAHSAVAGSHNIAIGRWDGDGAPDALVRKKSRLTLWRGNGPGGWTGSQSMGLNVSSYNWLIGIASADADTHSDLLARTRGSGDVWLLPGTARGFRDRVRIGNLAAYDLAG
ncbi:FG-GAP-like repeat-containing protein [Nocardioides sambongensis]|uniref:FG-GAP-like repeat-containing protein n=1 Tax=Nocardioides sambongensis TaxID=2589074 RepID=UPI00112B4777|nr:FG-GAP-like repeat-containing protein [Nocardioides sambongensis]